MAEPSSVARANSYVADLLRGFIDANPDANSRQAEASSEPRFHWQTLIICKLGSHQKYYTFTSILLTNVVLCSKFPSTNCINYKCLDMRFTTARLRMKAHPNAHM